MDDLTLTYSAGHLSIGVDDVWPELLPTDKGGYRLLCHARGGVCVDVLLDAPMLEQLGCDCLPHLRLPRPLSYTTAEAEAPFRKPARFFKELDDRLIQLLLREVQADALVFFLWYMKDEELSRKILSNCSERGAELLSADLLAQCVESDPDTAPLARAEEARDTVPYLLKLFDQLAGTEADHER